MGERPFTKALYKEGSAVQIREKIVNTDQEYWKGIEIIDYELYIIKNLKVLQKSEYKYILIFPQDDYQVIESSLNDNQVCWTIEDPLSFFTKACLKSLNRKGFTYLEFKYKVYNGNYRKYLRLTKNSTYTTYMLEKDLIRQSCSLSSPQLDIISNIPTMAKYEILKNGLLLKGEFCEQLTNDSQINKIISNELNHCKNEYVTKYFTLSKFCKINDENGIIFILSWYEDTNALSLIHKPLKDKNYIILTSTNNASKSYIQLIKCPLDSDKFSFNIQKKVYIEDSTLAYLATLNIACEDEAQINNWYNLLSKIIHKSDDIKELAKSTEDDGKSKDSDSMETLDPSNLFLNYLPLYETEREKVISSDLSESISNESLSFTFSCQDIHFALKLNGHQIEPYLTHVAIYDAKWNCRVTENFAFDINKGSQVQFRLDGASLQPDRPLKPTKAYFEISGAHGQMYVVVVVEKLLLKGPVPECTAPYRLSRLDLQGNLKPKVAQKYHRAVVDQAERYGNHKATMPFCVAIKPLLAQRDDLEYRLNTEGPFGIYAFPTTSPHNTPEAELQDSNGASMGTKFGERQLSQTPTDLVMKLLREHRKADKMRHLIIPGEVVHTLTNAGSEGGGGGDLGFMDIRKVIELDHPSRPLSSYEPLKELVNRFYIYPKHLNYQEQSVFSRARNIYCCAQFRESDDPNQSGLQVFDTGSSERQTHVYTTVLYHDSSPHFYTEFKMDLPLLLTPNHHLLFTFYHVSVNNHHKHMVEKHKSASFSTPVGYSWVPLLNAGRLINGTQDLPVCTALVKGYLSCPRPLFSHTSTTNLDPKNRHSTIFQNFHHSQPRTNGNANTNGRRLSASEFHTLESSKEIPSVKWVEAGKALFKISFDFVSALHTKDVALSELFSHLQMSSKHTIDVRREGETMRLLERMNQACLGELIKYSHPLFSQLLYLLKTAINIDMAQTILKLLLKMFDDMTTNGHASLVQSWVDEVMSWEDIETRQSALNPNLKCLPLYHTLVKVLAETLKPTTSDQILIAKLMNNFNYTCGMILKSIAVWLTQTGGSKKNRLERFAPEFMYDVKNLCMIITSNIAAKIDYHTGESKAWNTSLAQFFQGLFGTMDRGFIFDLVYCHITNLDSSTSSKALWAYKLDFLEKLLEYEHLLPLNLPRPSSHIDPDNPLEITFGTKYIHDHFLIGMLFRTLEISMSFHTEIRARTVALVRDILVKHSLDPRYQSAEIRNEIALLYLPLIGIYMSNLDKLSPKLRGNAPVTSSNLQDFKMAERGTNQSQAQNGSREKDVLTLIAGQELRETPNPKHCGSPYVLRSPLCKPFFTSVEHNFNGENDTIQRGHSSSPSVRGVKRYPQSQSLEYETDPKSTFGFGTTAILHPFSTEEKMDACISIVYIMTTLHQSSKVEYFKALRDKRSDILVGLPSLLILMHETLLTFSYDRLISTVCELSTEPKFEARDLQKKSATLQPQESRSKLPTDCHQTRHSYHEQVLDREKDQKRETDMWSNCCAHISYSVASTLFTLGHFIKAQKELYKPDEILLGIAVDVCSELLQDSQANRVIIFVLQNVDKFVIDIGLHHSPNSHTLYTKLLYRVIQKCNSRILGVRKQSCHTFYKILWNQFLIHQREGLRGFDIIKNLVMVALSQFLGDHHIATADTNLDNSMSYMASLTPNFDLLSNELVDENSYNGVIEGFEKSLLDLLTRVSSIQRSISRIKLPHIEIPEVYLDLEYELARSYSYNPELRRTWLINLAKLNIKFSNFSEAAFCYLHCSAIISRFLALNDNFYKDWQCRYDRISPNIVADEYELTDSYLASNLCLVNGIYSRALLLETLCTAIALIEKSHRWELVDDIYHMIIDVHKRDKKYEAISEAYDKLRDAYCKISGLTSSGRRYFGQYFKVNFYGEKFELDHTREFVYKEPHVTRLSEISLRLKAQYGELLGSNSVQLITHSKEVEIDLLDKNLAHIQIVHLQPYFPDHKDSILGIDLSSNNKTITPLVPKIRTTYEMNDKVQYFYFEVPFTMTPGKTYGEIDEQHKKKVIVKSQYCFPYVKTRVPVVWKSFVDLSPLEAAIEEMERKVQDFHEIYGLSPCDTVKLQLQLQGAISTQINSGPLAYAQAFLSPKHSVRWDPVLRQKLKLIFKSFIKIVQKCIHLHAKFYHKDQTDFHHMIEANFDKFVREIASIFGESFDVLTNNSDTEGNGITINSLPGIANGISQSSV